MFFYISGEMVDPMEIPSLIMEVYLTSKDFAKIYDRYAREIAFEPIPRKDKKYKILNEEYM